MLHHEVERPGADLRVTFGHEVVIMTPPARLSTEQILLSLYRPAAFVDFVLAGHDVSHATYAQITAATEGWARHFGLGDFATARRACFVMDRYGDELEWDFASLLPGEDLAALWQARRWRRLLALADRLPRWARYNAAVANDPEHAQMLADAYREQVATGGQKGPTEVPIETWTTEVEVLTELKDMTAIVAWAVLNQNAKNPSKPPNPSSRPTTAVSRLLSQAREQGRRKRHESLVARMLPHKPRPVD